MIIKISRVANVAHGVSSYIMWDKEVYTEDLFLDTELSIMLDLLCAEYTDEDPEVIRDNRSFLSNAEFYEIH
jgi:hypothetical protein